jgi:hypothetical protein
VNEDLVDLVHDFIGFLGTDFFREIGEPLHVAEHDRDLLAFTLDPVSFGQDLLGEAFGKVPLNFVYLVIKGDFFWGWGGGRREVVSAFVTKFGPRSVGRSAIGTRELEFMPAFVTKLGAVTILKLAFWAFHDCRPKMIPRKRFLRRIKASFLVSQ